MNFDPILRSILELLFFLETSDEDVVGPDAAIAVTERVAYLLGRMPSEDRDALCAELIRVAGTEDGLRSYATEVGDSLGLLDG